MRLPRSLAIQRRAADPDGGGAPGKRPLTSQFVARVAAAGVDGAGESLPHAAQVQASFGRFDLSDVKVATGGGARDAARSIGAEAYTTGDPDRGPRIAFAAEPTLHLVAHEAAHVVQQRAGVQLSEGVGASGDVYERHADAVADAVVRGELAEPLLAAGPGGGGGAGVQRFDSPHHVAIGDSVEGEDVVINEVTFTPGELAALSDYVPLKSLYDYDKSQLREMKQLLAEGNEETEEWDRVTGGNYSKEAQDNEKHFAPGEGKDFREMFCVSYARALRDGGAAAGDPAKIDLARLDMHDAEHYLEDAFSAGHQVAPSDVANAVDQVMTGAELIPMIPLIADGVWELVSDKIQCYGVPVGFSYQPLSKTQWTALAIAGALTTGQGGFHDAMRRYVHEQLDDLGVEVSSPAHPTPWTIHGDHSIDDVSILCVQQALDEVRQTFEANLSAPTKTPSFVAAEVFDKHCPKPTPGNGVETVRKAVADATADESTILKGMVSSTSETIEEVLDYVVVNMPWLLVRELKEVENEVHQKPEIPDHERPEEGGTDPDPDRDEHWMPDRDADAGADFSSDV